MKNVYGYDTFLEVPIPKGEELLDIRVPRKGDRVLVDTNLVHFEATLDWYYSANPRIILKPKPVLNNYGYKTYEEVPIPDGYEFVGVRLPTGDDEYISGSDAPFRVKPKTVRVIVKKKPQLNAYGFTNYEQVTIPEGYEKIGICEPNESGALYIPVYIPKDKVAVYTSGGPMEVRSPRTEAYEPLKHDRVIVRKKPILNEYGYERYEDVPLPAGEKFLKVAAPKQGDRVLGVSGSAYTSNSNFTSTKRIILQPRTKRYAVAKVELPDSWSDVQSVHSGSYCLVPDYKPGIRPASLETDWTITEEPC